MGSPVDCLFNYDRINPDLNTLLMKKYWCQIQMEMLIAQKQCQYIFTDNWYCEAMKEDVPRSTANREYVKWKKYIDEQKIVREVPFDEHLQSELQVELRNFYLQYYIWQLIEVDRQHSSNKQSFFKDEHEEDSQETIYYLETADLPVILSRLNL